MFVRRRIYEQQKKENVAVGAFDIIPVCVWRKWNCGFNCSVRTCTNIWESWVLTFWTDCTTTQQRAWLFTGTASNHECGRHVSNMTWMNKCCFAGRPHGLEVCKSHKMSGIGFLLQSSLSYHVRSCSIVKQDQDVICVLQTCEQPLLCSEPVVSYIHRELPSLAKSYVMRMVFLGRPLPQAAVALWVKKDSQRWLCVLGLCRGLMLHWPVC